MCLEQVPPAQSTVLIRSPVPICAHPPRPMHWTKAPPGLQYGAFPEKQCTPFWVAGSPSSPNLDAGSLSFLHVPGVVLLMSPNCTLSQWAGFFLQLVRLDHPGALCAVGGAAPICAQCLTEPQGLTQHLPRHQPWHLLQADATCPIIWAGMALHLAKLEAVSLRNPAAGGSTASALMIPIHL